MSKIPTVTEALEGLKYRGQVEEKVVWLIGLHVEAALKAASEKVKSKWVDDKYRTEEDTTMWDMEPDKQSILTAYPLENIK